MVLCTRELSRHDRKFLHCLVLEEFVPRFQDRRRDGMKQEIQRQHQSIPLSRLYFETDFCAYGGGVA